MKLTRSRIGLEGVSILVLTLMLPCIAAAHCDSLDGPVILDARAALERNDVTPVLKWVRAGDEPAVREAFAHAVAVRKLGLEAKDLADTYFFETLVRIHRAGEGAPYTGLKAAGTIEPAIQEADRALEAGSVDDLADTIAGHVAQGLHERFARAVQARKHATESIQEGREYVEAYVAYVHYVEAVAGVLHATGHAEGADRHP